MMIIETWIAILIVVLIAIFGAIGTLGWMASSSKNEKLHEKLIEVYKENIEVYKENAELKNYIAVQKTKSIIGVANDFYNEGKKK